MLMGSQVDYGREGDSGVSPGANPLSYRGKPRSRVQVQSHECGGGWKDGWIEGWVGRVCALFCPSGPLPRLRPPFVQAQGSTAIAAGVCMALGSD